MKINLHSVMSTRTSYGIVGTEILRWLVTRNHEVSLFPIGEVNFFKEDELLFKKAYENQAIYNNNNPSIKIFHEHMLADSVGKAQRIGFPIFELNRFDNQRLAHLNGQDMIFVTSKWAKEIMNSQVYIPTHIVNLGVDRFIYNENVRPLIPKRNTTRFINIGKFEHRKGIYDLVKMFNAAFKPNDAVELIMVSNNPFLSREEQFEIIKLYKESPLGNKIQFVGQSQNGVDRIESHSTIASIIASCDCGVFPTRAEGWNMPALECLSIGLPVIITNYSAHTEFCNKTNSCLVETPQLELAFDNKWFRSGIGEWAKFDNDVYEQFISYMREIHKSSQSHKLLNEEGIETAKRFSWENSVKQIEEGLNHAS